jgi:hypothetical protein
VSTKRPTGCENSRSISRAGNRHGGLTLTTARLQYVTILDGAFLYGNMTLPLEAPEPLMCFKRSDMSNETESDPKQQGKQDPTGKVNTSDTKTNPSPENQSQGNRPQDISKKNPPKNSDIQPQGQEKPEDEKRRAS